MLEAEDISQVLEKIRLAETIAISLMVSESG